MASDQRGSDQPNAVLRGGPLDGARLTVKELRDGIEREIDGWIYTYVPTGDPDEEFPACIVFIYVGERPAVWLAGGIAG